MPQTAFDFNPFSYANGKIDGKLLVGFVNDQFRAVKRSLRGYVRHDYGTIASDRTLALQYFDLATITLAANVTLTLDPEVRDGARCIVELTQDATGTRLVTWVNARWRENLPPTLSTAPGAKDVLEFVFTDGVWHGVLWTAGKPDAHSHALTGSDITGILPTSKGGLGSAVAPAVGAFLVGAALGGWEARAIAASDIPDLSATYATAGHLHDGRYSQLGHAHAGADITSGTVAPVRLGSGTPDATKYLRGDGVWTLFSGPGTHVHDWADITSGVPVYATRWPAWSEVTSKPTTVAGYGITDAALRTNNAAQLVPERTLWSLDGGTDATYGRAVNRSPDTYRHALQLEFKERAAIGAGGSALYAGMLTMAAYGDSSSGQTHGQIAFGAGPTWNVRVGQIGSGWQAWHTLALLEKAQTWAAAQTFGTITASSVLGPSGMVTAHRHVMYTPSSWGLAATYSYAALELREQDTGGVLTGSWAEAPRLSLHWGGRVASQIALETSGVIAIRNQNGDGYQAIRASDHYVTNVVQWDSGGKIMSGGSYASFLTHAGAAWAAKFGGITLSDSYGDDRGTHKLSVHGTARMTDWLYHEGQRGLYNSTSDTYWYSESANYWVSRSGAGIVVRDRGNNTKGYVYFDVNGFGLLDSAGAWRVQTTSLGGTLSGAWNVTGAVSIGGTLTGGAATFSGTVTANRFTNEYGHDFVGVVVSSTVPTSSDLADDGTFWVVL